MAADARIVKAEKPDALRQVTTWIIQGHSTADIAEALAENYRGTKAQPVIAEATKRLAAQGRETDEDLIRGFAMEGTRMIYMKALEVADHQTALRALKQMVDLAST